MNRARHWIEAERLQALGVEVVKRAQAEVDKQPKGLWHDVKLAELKTLAELYFRAAQISASLAQAGPGLDAEVAKIQAERPPMPPPPVPPLRAVEALCDCSAGGGEMRFRHAPGAPGCQR